ncbi:sensor histidine kinase [Tessaracoccus flavescens]|uniref:histidine kinase n=1 Tax=Tessaracoccus flavescens TaxID=399497 RepID=A0A1Q2CUS1_9ACTN|nr:histidine kinase [Tessaracoccus flavescens]AQP49852.1 hypothetical protein BW733_02395 [Tessaracoccus flavescens]
MFERVADFFGLNDDYVRPRPVAPWRTDWIIAALLTGISMSVVMYIRDVNPDLVDHLPLTGCFAAIIVAGLLITFRRAFPISVLLLASGAHFIVVGVLLPVTVSMASMQILYFLGIYTAMAYARRRQNLMLAMFAVLLSMAVWLVVADSYARAVQPDEFQPTLWYYVGTVVMNFAYFGVAIWLGQQAWLQAKARDALAESQSVVQQQGERLAGQAVVAERLRIARDLHDSVAHHISLIGVQTAAARRAMATRPELAAQAMQEVEDMSREAVTELRGMLGSLRDVSEDESGSRSVEALAALAEEASGNGLRVSYELVGNPRLAEAMSPMQASNLLRIAQEALTNVRRHSTATEARMVARLGDEIELEITDNGHTVPHTTGSGLGHVGIRERVAALGGTADIGPRSTRGYRVRVTLPRKAAS